MMPEWLCQWPFLSWALPVGAALWLVARGRMRSQRGKLTGGVVAERFPVKSKQAVQGDLEGGVDHEIRFTDHDGDEQSVRVSKSVYRQARAGDPVTVYRHPRSMEYVHESDPLSYSTASTSVLWALAWALMFVGVVDVAVYPIIGESPWCLVLPQGRG